MPKWEEGAVLKWPSDPPVWLRWDESAVDFKEFKTYDEARQGQKPTAKGENRG